MSFVNVNIIILGTLGDSISSIILFSNLDKRLLKSWGGGASIKVIPYVCCASYYVAGRLIFKTNIITT